MPSSARTLATAPSSMSVLRVRRLRSSLARRQSGRMLENIWVCLTWPAMTARVTPAALEGVDEAGELAEREPVDADGGVGGGAGIDLGIGLLLDGGDDDRKAVGARGIEQQEREASVAGDESEDEIARVHPDSMLLLPHWEESHKQCNYERTTAQREGLHGV